MVGFIFQFYLRRYRFMWWMRYNYNLSLAPNFSVAVPTFVTFFTVIFPTGGRQPLNWWGNTVYLDTADFRGIPLKLSSWHDATRHILFPLIFSPPPPLRTRLTIGPMSSKSPSATRDPR